MTYLNQAAFDQETSYRSAIGEDLSSRGAFLDLQGNVLFRKQTGGIIDIRLRAIEPGETLFRFTGSDRDVLSAMTGAWWVPKEEFDRVVRFAQVNELTDSMAARILLGVPPEWQDMRRLVKVRTIAPLLAYGGLANTVIIPHPDGGPDVVMVHQNANAERRIRQLFIPGLRGDWHESLASRVFQFEGDWLFTRSEAVRGWLYV